MAKGDADRLQHELESLFGDLWHIPRFAAPHRGFRPNVDVYTTDEPDEVIVVVELPGVDPAGVHVVAAERLLVIAGERERPHAPGRAYHQVEIEVGAFRREVRLARDIDPERATAHYEHGVLTVTLPAARRAAPAGRVPIEVRRS